MLRLFRWSCSSPLHTSVIIPGSYLLLYTHFAQTTKKFMGTAVLPTYLPPKNEVSCSRQENYGKIRLMGRWERLGQSLKVWKNTKIGATILVKCTLRPIIAGHMFSSPWNRCFWCCYCCCYCLAANDYRACDWSSRTALVRGRRSRLRLKTPLHDSHPSWYR